MKIATEYLAFSGLLKSPLQGPLIFHQPSIIQTKNTEI